MTSTLFDSRREQFVGNDGLPLAGGRLWIGKPDQDPKLVPVTVYADRQLTTPLAQPIRLDQDGRTEAGVWVSESYSYVLEDAAGNQQVEQQRIEVIDVQAIVDEIIGDLGDAGGIPNLLVNGGMQVALRNSVPLTDAFQEGAVNLAWGRATNVVSGNLEQGIDSEFSVSGYHVLYSGVEMPSTNDVIEHQQRLFSHNAARLVGRSATISCLVEHNGPVDVGFNILALRADAPDDFSGMTVIDTGPVQLVPPNTPTRISFTVLDMGQSGDGVASMVRVAAGSVTGFDLKISEFQIQVGDTLTAFVMREYREVRAAVYFEAMQERFQELDDAIDDRIEGFANGDPGYPRTQTGAIATGAVTTAKIATGAVTAAKIGAGEVTDSKLGATATTAGRTWVLNRLSLAAAGGVGTYVIAKKTGPFSGFAGFGDTQSGSNLEIAGFTDPGIATVITGQSLSGTWRCMGHTDSGEGARTTLWLRIS